MKTRKHYNWEEVTPQWVYINPNPKNRETGDCVIRAISLATGKPWAELLRDMTEWLIPRGEVFDEKKGFGAYLEQVHGFAKIPMPRKPDGRKYTLAEFLPRTKFGHNLHYVIQLCNHLTYARQEQFYDTWDCSGRCVLSYWVAPVEDWEKSAPRDMTPFFGVAPSASPSHTTTTNRSNP